jgi:hypothetical protein
MLTHIRRATASAVTATMLSIAVPMASLAAPPASTPFMESFPTQDHIVGLEPESSLCGFEITAEYSGTVAIRLFFDEAGDPKKLHVHIITTGSLSANGITLFGRSSRTQLYDFQASTVVEVGLVFMSAGPGTGVALMDRGRLVWSFDPDTGEWAFPPIFEAGPHPQLHGDVTGLCEALTP